MSYKFNDRFLILNIEDVNYRVRVDRDKLENCRSIFKEMTENNISDANAVIENIDRSIDSLIGEGAAERIFKGRAVAVEEHLDVMLYIYSETVSYMNRLAERLGNVR